MAATTCWCGFKCATESELLAHIFKQHAPRAAASETQNVQQGSEADTPAPSTVACPTCHRSFKHRSSLHRHIREAHEDVRPVCTVCRRDFANKRSLASHVKRCSPAKPAEFSCRRCGKKSASLTQHYRHKMSHAPARRSKCIGCERAFPNAARLWLHQRGCFSTSLRKMQFEQLREQLRAKSNASTSPEAWSTRTAVGGYARIHILEIPDEYDLQLTLLHNKESITGRLSADLSDLKRLKWYLVAHIRCQFSSDPVDGESDVRYARCAPVITLREDELEANIREAILGVLNSFDLAVDEGSQILFEKVEKLELRVAKYSPLRGSSFMELPLWLKNPKKGLINIHNTEDEKCFLYSVLAGVKLPNHNPQRVSSYKGRKNELDMSGIEFPVPIKSIDRFEKNNPSISISVFGLEDKRAVVPVRVSRRYMKRKHHVDLLLLQDPDSDQSHYVLIKNQSHFFAHLTGYNKKVHWCGNCLTPHEREDVFRRHVVKCLENASQAITMPSEQSSVMRFTEYEKMLKHDYVIYADLECILPKIECALPDPAKSNTTRVAKHTPCGFGYCIVGPDGTLVKDPVIEHGGEDIIHRFLLRLLEEQDSIIKIRGNPHVIDMTPESEQLFQSQSECYLCGQQVPRPGVEKVRDHDHTKAENNFRGAACQGCNLNLKRRDFIPVVFHNMTGYDSHHLISAIGLLSDGSDLSAIAKTKEKYISFTWQKLRFLDSLGFLSASLEKLVSDLKPEDMKITSSVFPVIESRNLASRKGVYPYAYFDCESKFELTELPGKESFKNDLTGEHVSQEDYDHALNVFKHFNMKNLWDYHDFYLKTDVVLLADVFETFRNVTHEHVKLDPAHFYTTPGLSWSAALLFTGQKLSLLTSYDDHLFWERGMRGGVASIFCRHAESNNKYVENYDPSKVTTFVTLFDCVNLYGAALSEPLPVGNFQYLNKTEVDEFQLFDWDPKGTVGFLLECDLEYPDSLHDAHNDFPLLPEHLVPQFKDLSPLQKEMNEMYGLSKNSSVKKLIPNLHDKKNYVIHFALLQCCVSLGIKISKIHKIMSFEQKAWLAPYIAFNTEMRKKATSDFQRNLWKLKNNSVFGKTCEQTKKRKNVSFTSETLKFQKLVKSPLFHSFEIFDHGLVCVERRKPNILLNRPVYTGQTVLDLSKKIMYEFHYKKFKPLYGDKVKVCATDTDSLIYHIETEDIYQDMAKHMDWYDTSDYPREHFLYSDVNKKRMGFMKDELSGTPIIGFVGLRAKMYSFITKKNMKCVGKGIPRAAMRAQLKYDDYVKCLKDKENKSVNFSKISTDQKHHIFTTYSVKKGLSCYDDKRYILPDNCNTLAFGHYSLRKHDEADDYLAALIELMECDEL